MRVIMRPEGATYVPGGPSVNRGAARGIQKKMAPRTLREAMGITQVDLEKRLGMDQSQISKMEAGDDHLVSTLRRYAEALGGELHVEVLLQGRRYRIG
jgi:hypothetical protein